MTMSNNPFTRTIDLVKHQEQHYQEIVVHLLVIPLRGVHFTNGMVTTEKRLHSKSLSRRRKEEKKIEESHEQPNNIIVQSMKNPQFRMAEK